MNRDQWPNVEWIEIQQSNEVEWISMNNNGITNEWMASYRM